MLFASTSSAAKSALVISLGLLLLAGTQIGQIRADEAAPASEASPPASSLVSDPSTTVVSASESTPTQPATSSAPGTQTSPPVDPNSASTSGAATTTQVPTSSTLTKVLTDAINEPKLETSTTIVITTPQNDVTTFSTASSPTQAGPDSTQPTETGNRFEKLVMPQEPAVGKVETHEHEAAKSNPDRESEGQEAQSSSSRSNSLASSARSNMTISPLITLCVLLSLTLAGIVGYQNWQQRH